MRLEVHDIASTQPGDVAVILLVLLVLNLKERLLCIFEFFCVCGRNAEVPREVIVIDEIRSNAAQIHKYIVKLLQDKEALRHALTPGNSVTLRGGCADHLKEILRNS